MHNICVRDHLNITQGHRVGGSENGNFPLLYVLKMSLCTKGVGGLKTAKTPLRNIKMVPKINEYLPEFLKLPRN